MAISEIQGFSYIYKSRSYYCSKKCWSFRYICNLSTASATHSSTHHPRKQVKHLGKPQKRYECHGFLSIRVNIQYAELQYRHKHCHRIPRRIQVPEEVTKYIKEHLYSTPSEINKGLRHIPELQDKL